MGKQLLLIPMPEGELRPVAGRKRSEKDRKGRQLSLPSLLPKVEGPQSFSLNGEKERGDSEVRRSESASVESQSEKRILAITFPRLICELAEAQLLKEDEPIAYGVVITDTSSSATVEHATSEALSQEKKAVNADVMSCRELSQKTELAAVSERAKKYGLRAGQSIADARAVWAQLQIVELSASKIVRALERVAESLFRYATCVSLSPPEGLGARGTEVKRQELGKWARALDTIWLDITGVAHLFDGERALCETVRAAALELGHSCRVGVANGPVLARALSKWQATGCEPKIANTAEMAQVVRSLPISALPIREALRGWLVRLGVLSFGDLLALPRSVCASRLEGNAVQVMDLIHGKDSYPLVAYTPAEPPREERLWEEPVHQTEALLFVLRGLCSRISVRLEGRGVAAAGLRLVVLCDPGVARFRGAQGQQVEQLALASPLQRAEDLFRVFSERVQRLQLKAPSIGLRVEVTKLGAPPVRQLELSAAQLKINTEDPETLSVLFEELASDIGRHRFGTLSIKPAHRPEKQSLLEPVALRPQKNQGRIGSRGSPDLPRQPGDKVKHGASVTAGELEEAEVRPLGPVPTRLLAKAIPVSAAFRKGALLALGKQFFAVESVKFAHRLEEVEWWSEATVSRDYVRLLLSNETRALEVLGYIDHSSGKRFVQGIFD